MATFYEKKVRLSSLQETGRYQKNVNTTEASLQTKTLI